MATVRPELRAIARQDGRIVGALSASRVATDPPRFLYGLGDLAVDPAARGLGVAGALGAALRVECWRRGAEILLMDSVVMLHQGLRQGWVPVPRFRFWYERDGACHWHPNWTALIRHPERRARLQLEEGDF